MKPGDPTWKKTFGTDTSVESQVKDGTIQDFVLPLDTPDAHALSLAVYVRPEETGAVLATLALDYANVMTQVAVNGYGPGTLVEMVPVVLPAGPAFRLKGTLPYTGKSTKLLPGFTTRDDLVAAYVIDHDGRAYYLVFRGNKQIFDDHAGDFACIAESMGFIVPAATASHGLP
jgi:hypothetical protein